MLKLCKHVHNSFLRRVNPPVFASTATCRHISPKSRPGSSHVQQLFQDEFSSETTVIPEGQHEAWNRIHPAGTVAQARSQVSTTRTNKASVSVLAGRTHLGSLSRMFPIHFLGAPMVLGRARAHILTRGQRSGFAHFSTSAPMKQDSLDHFRHRLERNLTHNPHYSVKSILKSLKELSLQKGTAHEIAFDILVQHKRWMDGTLIMQHMQKSGLMITNATRAKMMALSLAMSLPEQTDIEEVVYNICEIVGHQEYTEKQLIELLKIMDLYEVDRFLVALVVNHFRDASESRKGSYTPRLELLPDIVEALVRDGEVEKAFSTIEEIPDTETERKTRSISIAYTRLLSAIRDTCEWDPAITDRATRGIEQRNIPRQIPTTLFLSWAVSQQKYVSVLEIYDKIREEEDLVFDAHVFCALFEMGSTFHYDPHNVRFAPIAPRRLFRDMALAVVPPPAADQRTAIVTVKPDTALLTTALSAFMHQRDYAGALVVLDSFADFNIPLDNSTFYTVVKPLIHRVWGDIAHKRRVKEGQVKWGDRFLGTGFDRVKLSKGMIGKVFDKVSRENFELTEPLYVPSKTGETTRGGPTSRNLDMDAQTAWKEKSVGRRQVDLGPVKYPMPTIEMMETINPDAAANTSTRTNSSRKTVVYNPTPLKRLLRRAILAELLTKEEHTVFTVVDGVGDMERRAREEMDPLRVDVEEAKMEEGGADVEEGSSNVDGDEVAMETKVSADVA